LDKKKPLELIHVDIFGPMQTLQLNKNNYFIIFVVDFSRRTWVYSIKKNMIPLLFFNNLVLLLETMWLLFRDTMHR
jgi:hypothetical protein